MEAPWEYGPCLVHLIYVLHPNSVPHTHIRHSKHALVSGRSVLEGHQGFGNPEEEAMTAIGRSQEEVTWGK